MAKHDIRSLYYITHVANISSMLQHGILSHRAVEEGNVNYTPIYDSQIVSRRKDIPTPDGQTLWDFANLFFQPRNAMLYRVVHEKSLNDIAIIGVHPQVLGMMNVLVTTGNAASLETEVLSGKEGLKHIHKMWAVLLNEWWRSDDGSKRKMMAECLVPEVVPADMIQAIHVASQAAADRLRRCVPSRIPVIPEPHMFFQPTRRIRVSSNLSLVQGDMFFSTMQTLTISVNTVGIMGKGLASRAKYQFPDVYVTYQDACRAKKLKMGKPFLYKREALVDEQLADDPASLQNPNASKWFLLFATKSHWREDADLAGIEKGLQWLKNNYRKEGIESLALPALGCGLGRRKWKDVGPVICHGLSSLDIQAAVYLPGEREVPKEYLTPDYLLGRPS